MKKQLPSCKNTMKMLRSVIQQQHKCHSERLLMYVINIKKTIALVTGAQPSPVHNPRRPQQSPSVSCSNHHYLHRARTLLS